MNELGPTAIELTGIGKVYRLYRKRAYRLLDLFGLCPVSSSFFTEHVALNGVNLTIARGEKVAIIGRNGAGKSTLLKIITGAIKSTAGDVRVNGKVSALLRIGTGFHPDFTGRQNAYSSLALQGLTGREADAKFEEIVEFAELEEYIDQPMKTFSTGMCARLMFSASVVIAPDVLIVDEVLGVGDAYFNHKSFERMREICTSQGTTLLLVTHNIYSALKLCDRFIWLDRGHVKFDGEGKTAISLYESSIKEQEEASLRRRNVVQLDRENRAPARVHVLFRSRTGFALPAPLALEQMELTYEDGDPQKLDVAEGAPGWSLLPESNLGSPRILDGRRCREIATAGSIYHKAEWSVTVDPSRSLSGLRVRWHYRADEPVDVRVFADIRHVLIKDEIIGDHGWQESTFSVTDSTGELDVPAQESFGTGQVRIRSVECLDRDHRPLSRARHGEALIVRFTLDVSDDLDRPEVTFLLGFNRPGLPYGCYAVGERMALPAGRSVQLDVSLDPLLLGSGKWMMTYAVGEADMYGQVGPLPYFTVNDRWYHFVARGSDLEVESTRGLDESGCFAIHPCEITAGSVVAPEINEKTTAGGM